MLINYHAIGFADVANEYNGLFFSIFQFTGCVGATICGIIVLFTTGQGNVCTNIFYSDAFMSRLSSPYL